MKRRHRLTDSERFRQVRQSGTSYSHSLLVLAVLPNEQDFSRCGFVTSRRIGKAVVRNRVRRRMREAVRSLWDLIEPGWDMVWIARPAIRGARFSELQEACARLLGRAHLLITAPMPEDRPQARIGSNDDVGERSQHLEGTTSSGIDASRSKTA